MTLAVVAVTGVEAVLGILLAFAILMLVRNAWVYHVRGKILFEPGKTMGEQLERYDRLPSYDTMMRRFWIWDVRKFEEPER